MSDLLSCCTEFLLAHGYDAYLVGGTVRDQEMGRESHDIDLAVPSAALHIARHLADHLGGAYYPLDVERETGRIVLPEHTTVDIARLRGSDITADLAARDFTVNAMARWLSDLGTLIDPHAGLRDLSEKRLRAVNSRIFADDPARLLRAVRLAAELDFEIEPATSGLIQQNVSRVTDIAGERARDELLRIMQRADAAASVRALARLGLLAPLLPHAHVSPASRSTLEQLGTLAADPTTVAGPPSYNTPNPLGTLAAHSAPATYSPSSVVMEFRQLLASNLIASLAAGQTDAVVVKLAALYADPADVVTDLGALRFRRDEIHYARLLVAGSARVRELTPPVAPLDAHRYFRDTSSDAGHLGLLLLALAESSPGLGAAQVEVVRQLLRYYRDSHDRVIAPAPLINGAELAARFGLHGRQIGDRLKLLLEAQVQGAIRTVADAERFLQQQ